METTGKFSEAERTGKVPAGKNVLISIDAEANASGQADGVSRAVKVTVAEARGKKKEKGRMNISGESRNSFDGGGSDSSAFVKPDTVNEKSDGIKQQSGLKLEPGQNGRFYQVPKGS